MDWMGCELVEVVPGKVSGTPVLKGTRLPADTVTDNVDAFVEGGQTLEQAILSTLDSFPSVPGGVETVRQLLAFRDSREHQLVA